VADEEGEFGVGEEGALGDRVGGEEGGGASEGAGAKASGGEGVRARGEAGGEEVPGESVGEDGLCMAVCEEANIGDGREVGRWVEEKGVDGVVKVGVIGRWDGESGCGGDGGKDGVEGGKSRKLGGGEGGKVRDKGRRSGLRERAGRLSMREAAKAAKARVVGSGSAAGGLGRRSWKAVRRWPSERSLVGLMRRMVAIAKTAAVCAASVKVGSFGVEGCALSAVSLRAWLDPAVVITSM